MRVLPRSEPALSPPVPMARRVPAVLLHVLVALVDLTFVGGEIAIRVAGGVASLFLGDKARSAAVEGFLHFLFMGNWWWILLHAAAAGLLMLGRSRWRWGFGAALVTGRLLFVLVNGRPWFDIGNATWPAGLGVFYTVVMLALLGAQALAFPRAALLDAG